MMRSARPEQQLAFELNRSVRSEINPTELDGGLNRLAVFRLRRLAVEFDRRTPRPGVAIGQIRIQNADRAIGVLPVRIVDRPDAVSFRLLFGAGCYGGGFPAGKTPRKYTR